MDFNKENARAIDKDPMNLQDPVTLNPLLLWQSNL
jgi:hypothetical protein